MTKLTAAEQLSLELINRARLDPLGEAQRLGIDINRDVDFNKDAPLDGTPRQVLAPNNTLTDVARKHVANIWADPTFQATGNKSNPHDFDGKVHDRIAAAGFSQNNIGFYRNENWGVSQDGAALTDKLIESLVYRNHNGLFADDPKFYGAGAGHRLTMLDGRLKEAGIGDMSGKLLNGNSTNVVVQNFGVSGTQSFITGVVYNDTRGAIVNGKEVGDLFYSMGEGVANVGVSVKQGNTSIGNDTTGSGGGYSVAQPATPGALYTVTFSGGGLAKPVSAIVDPGILNAKVDLVNGNEINSSANVTLGDNAVGLRLIGIQNINGTGNALANVITGNKGNNILTGMGGNDTIDGLGGIDTVVFSGKQSDYKIVINGNTATLQDMRGGSPDGMDTITNIEFAKFADATVAYSALKNQTPAAAVAGSVSINDMAIAEGNAGTKVLTFTLTRAGGTAAFDVNFATSNGTAIAGEDFAAASGVVRFAAGETTKTVSVTINGDTKFEANESFNVNLSNATNGATIADAIGVGTIQNDDIQAVAGSVSINDMAIAEGNSGSKVVTFTLTRAGGTAAFDVNFATGNATAIAGEDYAVASGVVRFAAGETKKTVSVTILGDTKFEANETFTVNLSNATNGATIADAIGVGTITNDDANRAPTITSSNVKVAAGSSVAVTSIFTAQDLDGNSTITKYAFWDAGNGGGFFTVNGVAQASGQWIHVDAANLGNVRYVGGVNGGVENLWATAFDGNAWSVNKSAVVTTLQRAPEDFNKDGNTDILFHNNNGSVAMWQIDGTKVLANVGVGSQASSWHAKDAFDFNGDGKADVLWHNDSGKVELWQMDGAKVAQKLDLGSMATNWKVADVNDFNGDGKAEVLWTNEKGQLQMWNMNGAAHTTTNVGTVASGWTIQDTADFNGDGKADILLRNGKNLAMWQMDGGQVAKTTTFGNMGDAFQFAATGDFNGDGKSDILWQNDSNGQVVMWQMDGTAILSNTTVGTAKGWDIAKVGDFNHDGRADILFQNAAGVIAEWQMDANKILANQTVGSVSTDWHIV
jgi:hypothetical protein